VSGERIVGWAYRVALFIVAPVLLAGLVLGSTPLLRAGILVLMASPLVGVVIVALSLLAARDWTFAGVALIVIAILASSLYAAAHVVTAAPAATAPAAPR
jgi:hypothetical protein